MSIPVGGSETFRFSLTSRALTAAELKAFVQTGVLPAGVGEDPDHWVVEYQGPGAAVPTATEVAVRDGQGAFHVQLVLTEEGAWRWRATAYGPGGEVLTVTPWLEAMCGDEEAESTVEQLVASVKEDGQLDASEAQVLRWLNTRHRQLCARTKCYRRTVDLGALPEGQSSIAVPPGVVEILQVQVGDQVYGHARHQDFQEGERGFIWLGGGEGGIAGREDSETGQQRLRIFPALSPGIDPEPGAHVVIYAAMQPPPLVAGQDSSIKVPDDYFDALVSGALATAMLRVEARQDLAASHEEIFTTACGELLRETNRKYRGVGPARIRIIGINA